MLQLHLSHAIEIESGAIHAELSLFSSMTWESLQCSLRRVFGARDVQCGCRRESAAVNNAIRVAPVQIESTPMLSVDAL